MAEQSEALRRIDHIEQRMDNIEAKVTTQGQTSVELKAEFTALRSEFSSLKEDVLVTVKDHTDKIWTLIEKCMKIIITLIIVIVALAGLKLGPDIIKALIGGG